MVFQQAGPRLGIGFDTPSCSRKHIPITEICDGDSKPSTIANMQWCEKCKPESCPLVNIDGAFVKSENTSHLELFGCSNNTAGRTMVSLVNNLCVCDWLPIERIPERESCLDARLHKGKIMCRVCDMSDGTGFFFTLDGRIITSIFYICHVWNTG